MNNELNAYAPKFLSDGAKSIWRRLQADMKSAGVLKALDYDLFSMYCQTLDHYQKSVAQFVREGSLATVPSKAGDIINPLLRIQSTLNKDVLSMATKLGISAASRASKGLAAEAGRDEAKNKSTFGDL